MADPHSPEDAEPDGEWTKAVTVISVEDVPEAFEVGKFVAIRDHVYRIVDVDRERKEVSIVHA